MLCGAEDWPSRTNLIAWSWRKDSMMERIEPLAPYVFSLCNSPACQTLSNVFNISRAIALFSLLTSKEFKELFLVKDTVRFPPKSCDPICWEAIVTSYISIVGSDFFKNSFTMIPNSTKELLILPSFVPMLRCAIALAQDVVNHDNESAIFDEEWNSQYKSGSNQKFPYQPCWHYAQR